MGLDHMKYALNRHNMITKSSCNKLLLIIVLKKMFLSCVKAGECWQLTQEVASRLI